MLTIRRWIRITPDGVRIDGRPVAVNDAEQPLPTALYRQYVGDYPKFFKMDPMCRLGFIASELLLRDEPERFTPREDCAVVLFSRSGSFASDSHYQQTIADAAEYYPSPAVFVYTLANIATGEIAIRNKFYGETICYLTDRKCAAQITATVRETFLDPGTRTVLCGWVESPSAQEYEATLALVGQDPEGGVEWNERNVAEIMDIQR